MYVCSGIQQEYVLYACMHVCMYVCRRRDCDSAPVLSNAELIFLDNVPLLVSIHRVRQVPPLIADHQLVRRARLLRLLDIVCILPAPQPQHEEGEGGEEEGSKEYSQYDTVPSPPPILPL